MLVGLGGECRAENQLGLNHGQIHSDGLKLSYKAGVVVIVVTVKRKKRIKNIA